MRPSETKPRLSAQRTRTRLVTWEQRLAVRRDLHHHYAAAAINGVTEKRRHELERIHGGRAHEARAKVHDLRRDLAWYKQHEHPRQRVTKAALSYAGKVTENPAGSNRGGVITTWEQRLANGGSWLVGTAWCGTFAANMLLEGNVAGVNSRQASVSYIEDDARAARGPFTAWTLDASRARPGDLVVLFGRGVHVEVVIGVDTARRLVRTVGGNTSSGTAGSQSNGGGVFERWRPFTDVHGFALVRYPTA